MTSRSASGAGSSSSSSSRKSIVSTTWKSCQSMSAIASRSFSASSSALALAASCERSHSRRCSARSRRPDLSSSFRSRASSSGGGFSTLEYASASEVKNPNIEWVGFRKLN